MDKTIQGGERKKASLFLLCKLVRAAKQGRLLREGLKEGLGGKSEGLHTSRTMSYYFHPPWLPTCCFSRHKLGDLQLY